MSLLTVFSLKNTGRKFVPLTVPSSECGAILQKIKNSLLKNEA